SSSLTSVALDGTPWRAGKLATGDYFIRPENAPEMERRLITENSAKTITIAAARTWPAPTTTGAQAVIEVRLQKPVIDPDRCIGCGVCQHECPVSGLRAIRVTAENESRTSRHSLTPRAG
ncbi:MAG TPA: 4Fe-4S binding protein, partial [Candidatus Limnocylindrales bacterium]|nr:4Fe-4S binding protein [Candidatus Limnocylindrales bacterium]